MSAARPEAKRVGRPSGPLKPVTERLKLITERELAEALVRTPLSQHVIWNGSPALSRGPSLRARAIGCVQEVGVAVSLRVVLQRAARLDNGCGLDPDLVRSAIRQHQFAQPAVLLLVDKRPSGDFVAVTDVPFPSGLGRPIAAGQVVIGADGRRLPGFGPPQATLVA